MNNESYLDNDDKQVQSSDRKFLHFIEKTRRNYMQDITQTERLIPWIHYKALK